MCQDNDALEDDVSSYFGDIVNFHLFSFRVNKKQT